MSRHPFDPVSAVLGVLALTAGLLVVVGDAVDVDTGGGRWIAVAAVLVGLMIIPWRRRAPSDRDVPADTP
ncbi:MAG: hypothetical protein ABW219_17150 [Ilumatobacteraceae bacterium]